MAASMLRFAAGFACLACVSAADWTIVRVVAPVDPATVTSVKLGRTPVQILATAPADSSPAIILVDSIDPTLVAELQAFEERQPGNGLEVWAVNANGWEYDRAASAGCTVSPRIGGRRNRVFSPLLKIQDALDVLGRRYWNRGPVRVFVLSRSFDLDRATVYLEDEPNFGWTALEDAWPSLGAAGLTVFPVRPPEPEKKLLPGTRRRTVSTALFGTSEYVTGAPGEALEAAMQDSARWTVFTLRVPVGQRTWRRTAPWLRLYSGRKPVFERRLLAPKEPPPDPAVAEADLREVLCRVLPVAIQISDGAAGYSSRHHNRHPHEGGSRVLMLRSVDWALSGPQEVEHVVDIRVRPAGGTEKPRSMRARFIRTGEWACIWGVAAGAGDELTISSAAGDWMVRTFQLGPPLGAPTAP